MSWSDKWHHLKRKINSRNSCSRLRTFDSINCNIWLESCKDIRSAESQVISQFIVPIKYTSTCIWNIPCFMGVKGNTVTISKLLKLLHHKWTKWIDLTLLYLFYHWNKIASIGSINMEVEKESLCSHSILDSKNLFKVISSALFSWTNNANNNKDRNVIVSTLIESLFKFHCIHTSIQINLYFFDAAFSNTK